MPSQPSPGDKAFRLLRERNALAETRDPISAQIEAEIADHLATATE